MKIYVDQSVQKLDEQFEKIMASGGKIPIFYENFMGVDRTIIAYRKNGNDRYVVLRRCQGVFKVDIGADKIYIVV